MPVRNKKKNLANRQKNEKAQHLKQFVSEIKDLITKAAGPDIAGYIPQHEIEHLYTVRLHPVRIRVAPGESVDSEIVQFTNHLVTIFFKGWPVPIAIGALEQVSLYDFFSTVYTLMLYIQRLKEEDYTRALEVKKALAPLAAIISSPLHEEAFSKYNKLMITIALFCSDLNEHLYTIKLKPAYMARGISKAGVYSEIYRKPLPKVKVMVDGQPRPAFHLGWYLAEPELRLKLISISSEVVYQAPGKMLDVYIQSHALNRLAERLEGIELGILHFSVFDSLDNPKVCRSRKGVLLFEFDVFGDKLGYFLGEVTNGNVLLKTFLFLTHNGTPEADRLQVTLGLMKEDIMYLGIDKLSTFIMSDIASNERLKQLFIDAGCEVLFEFDRGLYRSFDENSVTSKAEAIARYLQLDVFPLYRS
jgi:hypothetical protein